MRDNEYVNFDQTGDGTTVDSGHEQEMTVDEAMLRNKIAQAALSWVGTQEGSAEHAEIVSIFNSIGPWPITMQSPWCAAFVSVCAYQAGVDDVVYVNASCGYQIGWYENQGEFTYNKYYMPQVGDLMYFDWDTTKEGAEHVGIVVATGNKSFTVVDGNRNGHGSPDYVSKRDIDVGTSYIYGFATPNYAKISKTVVERSYEKVKYTPPTAQAWEDWITDGQRNWLRVYRLEAGPEGETGGFELGEFDGAQNPPLRIQFDVEKGDFQTMNNSTIKIWNLGEKHRDILSTPGCYLKLRAGYGVNPPLITQGIVAKAIDSYDGGNLVSELEIIDIRRVIRDTYVAISEKQPISGKDVVLKITEQMGKEIKDGTRFSDSLVWRTYDKFFYVGTGLKGLERVCVDHGFVCTVLNGSIDIHMPNEVLSKRAILLSAETGLIGNPKRLIETVNATYYLKGWQVEFMMNGAIDLGSYIKLESPFVPGGSGYYDVIELHITGDSMGEGWKCSAKLSDPYFAETVLFDPNEHGIRNSNASNSNFID